MFVKGEAGQTVRSHQKVITENWRLSHNVGLEDKKLSKTALLVLFRGQQKYMSREGMSLLNCL